MPDKQTAARTPDTLSLASSALTVAQLESLGVLVAALAPAGASPELAAEQGVCSQEETSI